MPRPKLRRHLRFNPEVIFFKPRGVPLRNLEVVELFPDEIEAIKLYFVDDLDQTKSAEMMKISQPTFARIVNSAMKKLSMAIVEGKAIQISHKDDAFKGQ
ncbi:DUF134 domain-containing protein [candidate division WWE3 bacterium]|jgi:predicted DNA-binding protein (UPF0251 family)|uniref:UPF0251 protein C4561_04495 n=1 Tax=candidate division WWE3 bacterium TaxID=2053526 RepID=A0A3A4ZJI2_UNCKA|nr:MAG: DUF134 domain-containing protein [candidate division WWE3 bacterium]